MSQDEKTQAMLMWVLCFVLGILSPIIFMIVGKDKPGVYRNSMQALTFAIIVMIVGVAAWILAVVLMFATKGLGALILFPLFGAIGIFSVYVNIMGAIAASNGNVYEPPITGPFARSWFKV